MQTRVFVLHEKGERGILLPARGERTIISRSELTRKMLSLVRFSVLGGRCAPLTARRAAANHALKPREFHAAAIPHPGFTGEWHRCLAFTPVTSEVGQGAATLPPYFTSFIDFIKRTFQPSVLRRKRKHGFLKRVKSANGQKILKRRLLKGRRKMSH